MMLLFKLQKLDVIKQNRLRDYLGFEHHFHSKK